jgi:hypothetical protein
MTDSEFEALVHEAVEIKYVIFEAGGMATKTAVEDVLMLRHPGLGRHEAHDVLNRAEFLNLKIRKPYACEANADRPTLDDYPEIGQVNVPYMHRQRRGAANG